MEKFICASCNSEKEGVKLDWHELFEYEGRIKEGIYICNSCGACICSACKESKIKTSVWSAWKKSVCPSCNELFAPIEKPELKRGKNLHAKKMNEEIKNEITCTTEPVEKNENQVQKNKVIVIPPVVNFLKFIAWANLIVSVIIAIVIWSNSTHYNASYQKVTDPITVGIGFGFLIEGIIVCILFLVIALIAENVIELRHNSKE